MASLAIFDFDRTIVDDDSDATIINRLREKQPPPEWDSTNHDWTPYMSDVFEHAYSAGLSEEAILSAIGGMKPTPGLPELLAALSTSGWDVLLITDANQVFVRQWLKTHGLLDCVTEVITNGAFFKNGRLYIEPCMNQTACRLCPTNLCKSLAMAQWCATRPKYGMMLYAGDGRNDFCPTTNMPENAIVFPRRGFPLEKMIKTSPDSVRAKVVPWEHCRTIMEELGLSNVIKC